MYAKKVEAKKGNAILVQIYSGGTLVIKYTCRNFTLTTEKDPLDVYYIHGEDLNFREFSAAFVNASIVWEEIPSPFANKSTY